MSRRSGISTTGGTPRARRSRSLPANKGEAILLTWCSGNGGAYPRTIATGSPGITGVNDFLHTYLTDNPGIFCGIVGLDFPEYPDDTLIDQIISGNDIRPLEARRIMCIRKHDHADPDHPIRWVGGVEIPSGKPFSMTQTDCITSIRNGERFFVLGPRQRHIPVEVREHVPPWSNEPSAYIATVADETETDNLLSLPDCPAGVLDLLFPRG